MEKVYTSPYPLYAPLVNPLESILVGAAGVADVQLLTLMVGLAPANESVVKMRSVRAAVDVPVKRIVVGSLTPLICAIGKSAVLPDPTVKVIGPQEPIRESEGCMTSWLAALRNPRGVPSTAPRRNTTDAGTSSAEEMEREVVAPAETLTPITVATLSSPLYRTMV